MVSHTVGLSTLSPDGALSPDRKLPCLVVYYHYPLMAKLPLHVSWIAPVTRISVSTNTWKCPAAVAGRKCVDIHGKETSFGTAGVRSARENHMSPVGGRLGQTFTVLPGIPRWLAPPRFEAV